MRAPAKVILIAFSASVIGPPVAGACSPQDYMSPEEWQALSPEQQAENVAHTHDAAAAAAAAPPVAPETAVEAPANEVAPPTGDTAAGTSPAADAPSAVAVPRAPVRERSARGETRQRRVIVRMPAERTPAVSSPPRQSAASSAAPTSSTARPAAAATVTAREPAVGARAVRSDAEAGSRQRRSGERRRTADQRPRATSPRIATRDADATEPMPAGRVAAEASPAVATRQGGERVGSGPWAAIAGLLAAVAAMVAVILGRPGTRARGAAATDPPAPLDPVESELQAIIAGERSWDAGGPEGGVASDAQDVRV